jgi:glycosidase
MIRLDYPLRLAGHDGPAGRRAASLIALLILSASSLSARQLRATAPDWRDGGVCYEVFVRSFQDGDGDGIGDLDGLIRRLDYINDGDTDTRSDLGARCIWLMPFFPSPSYHGYDITDYYRVAPVYGTNDDFIRLIEEAHRRGIAVIIDMVMNHTSSEHPWFRDAALNPDSPYRDYYRWSREPGPNNEWGDNNWRRSPVRDEYFYGFFWNTMPDLNWESPAVRDEMKRVAAFWLNDMGADGLRLDAIRHLMESDDGRAANVPRTHDMLREYASHVRTIAPDAFTIGEVFDSTRALLPYYPDQLESYFAFEVADAILEAVVTGSGASLLDAVTRLQSSVPDHRWAPFLRNHDQPRTLTVLEGDTERAKLAASLLLTLPGIPFVYYGEEIGMTGDKPDLRIRTPMQWSHSHAVGFTDGLPWEPLRPDSLIANVETQDGDPLSLLTLYRELIHLRAAEPSLAAGDFVPIEALADNVVAYLRRTETHAALVIANLGEMPLSRVRLSSGGGALAPGEYRAEVLWGDARPARLRVASDGSISDYRVNALAPLAALVIRLDAAARTR